jgi:hypothetical protein
VDINIHFGHAVPPRDDVVISTIPMPELMKNLGYDQCPQFNSFVGTNLKTTLSQCDAYVSLMVPDPDKDFSRISLTGSELIVECPGEYKWTDEQKESMLEEVTALLGITNPVLSATITAANQHYAKINPIDDDARKQFIFWATDKANVFSLGRYATWRPGLLLDDLVQDIRLIERWIKDRYNMSHHRSKLVGGQ